jgi:murein DD-endopeptidase MepM/ murein hydrolase activator NlpD
VLLILLVLLAWESDLMVASSWQVLSAPATRTDREEYSPSLSSRQPGGFLKLVSAPVAVAAEQEKRIEIVTYTVQPGDTVYDIARRFGITGETILWSNPELEKIPDLLSVGEDLVILPVSGVYHTVEPDDTVESLAEEYKVDPSAITEFELNTLSEPYQLVVGQKLVIPGGEKPFVQLRKFVAAYSGPIPEDASKGTGSFGWPVSGRITQQFWAGHQAIDIGASTGTPIYASDSGFVVVAGWSDIGYGYTLVIDHGNGFQTRYAHLSLYYPDAGQSVAKGEQIGDVGSTGRSTGPHLHFEIIENGVRRNPFGFLP